MMVKVTPTTLKSLILLTLVLAPGSTAAQAPLVNQSQTAGISQTVTPTEPGLGQPVSSPGQITPDEPPAQILPAVPPVSVPPSQAVMPPVPAVIRPRVVAPQTKTAAKPRPKKPLSTPAPRVIERMELYGRSSMGRPLIADILTQKPEASVDTTLIFGGFHGNERSTPAVIEALRAYLKQSPTAWPGTRVVLVPVANPDGWNAGTRVDSRQVDLNRNFPIDWSRTGRAARNNPGPAPASEPETRAMMTLLRQFHPQKVLSLHSPLHCLNPTGPVGTAVAERMHQFDHLPVQPDIGYPTPGSLGDYCGSLGIGIVTLELPDESAATDWGNNRDALLAAINYHGRVVRESKISSYAQKRF